MILSTRNVPSILKHARVHHGNRYAFLDEYLLVFQVPQLIHQQPWYRLDLSQHEILDSTLSLLNLPDYMPRNDWKCLLAMISGCIEPRFFHVELAEEKDLIELSFKISEGEQFKKISSLHLIQVAMLTNTLVLFHTERLWKETFGGIDELSMFFPHYTHFRLQQELDSLSNLLKFDVNKLFDK